MALTESEKRNEKKEKPLTKVVVRRLPPQMTQEEFLNQISPVPDYNYFYMVRGDMNLGPYAFSRVYINFTRPEDVFTFKEKFDNYVFLDNKGNEYAAVVEFASFQKIPKKRGKNRMDPKCKTIESDSYFCDFVASLTKTEEQEEKPEYTLQLTEKNNKEEETTPLLEYIKNKKAQKQKIREIRREEREKKRKEYESRKRDYHKAGYERKAEREDKSFVNKSYSSNKPNKKENEEDIKPEKNSEKSDRTDRHNEKPSSSGPKSRDRAYEEKRKEIKPRFPKKEYPEQIKKYDDYKERGFKSKYYDENSYHKKQEQSFPKKVKKYSERREERKMEALKAEQKKLEQQEKDKSSESLKTEETVVKNDKEQKSSSKESEENNHKKEETLKVGDKVKIEKTDSRPKRTGESVNKTSETNKDTQKDTGEKNEAEKNREEKANDKGDSSASKSRIRNKDRPTIEIYRPGMLSKKKQNNGEGDGKKNDGDDCSKKSD